MGLLLAWAAMYTISLVHTYSTYLSLARAQDDAGGDDDDDNETKGEYRLGKGPPPPPKKSTIRKLATFLFVSTVQHSLDNKRRDDP